MVFEQIFKPKKIAQHPEYSLYLGVLYALLAFGTANVVFMNIPSFIGVATLLFTIILSVPLVIDLFRYEEQLELKEESFFRKHKIVTDFFIYFFLGIFMVFFVLALAMPDKVFSQSQLYQVEVQEAEKGGFSDVPEDLLLSAVFKNNFYVMVIAFGLSFFYGSGALFLIVLNAAIFSSTLAEAIRIAVPPAGSFMAKYSFIACNLSVMFFHMIPEMTSYLLAAIAGGVLSKALLKERLFSKHFFKVFKNAFLLMMAALITLYIAALVEVKISRQLYLNNVCSGRMDLILLIAAALLIGILAFEFFRKKRLSYHKIYVTRKNNDKKTR